jgi:hypothetical protein
MSTSQESTVTINRGILDCQSGSYLDGRLIVQKNGVVRFKTLYKKSKK